MRTLPVEITRITMRGRPAVTNLPVIPADAPPRLREGLRRRRVAALRGRCPCGARRTTSPFPPARTYQTQTLGYVAGSPAVDMPFQHRPECPAHDDLLGPALAQWQQGDDRGAQTR
jgi:hypothetical protein